MATEPQFTLDAEARARGLTRRGRDLVLVPHTPITRFTAGLPKPTQRAITDAAECGFAYIGAVGLTGYAWAIDDRRDYHATHSTTRGGVRQSRHACGRLRGEIEKAAAALLGKALYVYAGVDPEFARQRELDRLALVGNNPVWRCDLDGPIIEHAPISAAAIALFSTAEVAL